MNSIKNDSSQQMKTLSECVNKAVDNGYKENFTVIDKKLVGNDRSVSFNPGQVAIANFYRFEGYSDPEDNAILYLIETEDGTKGTLMDSYGAMADDMIADFIREVEDIEKQDKTEK